MMATYLAEGQYSICRQGNILHIEAKGPFDEHMTSMYRQDLEGVTDKLTGGHWGSLVSYYGNGLFTPEAELQLIETTKYRISRGLVATAAVFLQSTQADLQQMQLQRVYQHFRIPFHVFNNQENAKDWLQNYLEQANVC